MYYVTSFSLFLFIRERGEKQQQQISFLPFLPFTNEGDPSMYISMNYRWRNHFRTRSSIGYMYIPFVGVDMM
jgi:hypothetical protein